MFPLFCLEEHIPEQSEQKIIGCASFYFITMNHVPSIMGSTANNMHHGRYVSWVTQSGQHRHNQTVSEMTNELRQLIDIANMPIFGIDVDGIVNEWNEKTAAITGYLREEAMDEPLLTTLIVSKLQKAVEEVMVMP